MFAWSGTARETLPSGSAPALRSSYPVPELAADPPGDEPVAVERTSCTHRGQATLQQPSTVHRGIWLQQRVVLGLVGGRTRPKAESRCWSSVDLCVHDGAGSDTLGVPMSIKWVQPWAHDRGVLISVEITGIHRGVVDQGSP